MIMKPEIARGGVGGARVLWSLAATLALLAGGIPALAQQQSKQPPKTPDTEAAAARAALRGKQDCGDREPSKLDLTPPPPDAPQPKFVCEHELVPGKKVWKGEKSHFSWNITNAGEGVLKYTLKAGCAITIIGPIDRVLQPAQTDTVEIDVDTTNKGDTIRPLVSVLTNDRNTPKARLRGMGRVLVPFVADPTKVNFGKIERDSGPVAQRIEIRPSDGGPINLQVAAVDPPNLEAYLVPTPPLTTYTLVVRLAPPWPNGPVIGSVTLDTGVTQLPQDTILVFANIAPRLRAHPDRFIIRPRAAQPLDTSVRLGWSDSRQARVLGVEVSDPQLKVDFKEQKDMQIVSLHVPAAYAPDGKSPPVVTVKTEDPEAPTLEIPVHVLEKATPPRPKATAPSTK